MAYQGDPVSKAPEGLEGAPLTPDDLERLSSEFRPSWELDEAPFTGAGSLSPSDITALNGGGTHADVRAATAATRFVSSAHPPARSVGTVETAESIVVAPVAAAAAPVASSQRPAEIAPLQPAPVQPFGSVQPPPALVQPYGSVQAPAQPYGSVQPAPVQPYGSVQPAPAVAQPFGSALPPAPAQPYASAPPAAPTASPYAPVQASQPAPAAVVAMPPIASADNLAATRIVPRRAAPIAPMRPRVESVGSDMVRLARPSRKGLWVGLGGLAIVAVGIGAWASMSPSTDKSAPVLPPSPPETATHAAPDFPPPPLPDTKASTASAGATAAQPTQAANTAMATAASKIPTITATSLPVVAPPVVTHNAAPPPATHVYVAPAPAPKPAAKPRSGGSTTIVRDAPF
jgi:hypothetical protein